MFENQSSRRFVVSEGERRFFQDFGYLRLRGWLLDDMPWIIDAFETVFADTYRKWNVTIDPTNRRYILAPFIDLSNELATLVDHPAIEAAFTALLGDSWGYLARGWTAVDDPIRQDGNLLGRGFARYWLPSVHRWFPPRGMGNRTNGPYEGLRR